MNGNFCISPVGATLKISKAVDGAHNAIYVENVSLASVLVLVEDIFYICLTRAFGGVISGFIVMQA